MEHAGDLEVLVLAPRNEERIAGGESYVKRSVDLDSRVIRSKKEIEEGVEITFEISSKGVSTTWRLRMLPCRSRRRDLKYH